MNPFKSILNWFRYVLTDQRNQWELALLFWYAGVGLFLYRSYVSAWDPQAFGIGFGAVLAGGGGMRWILNQLSPAADFK